MLFEDQWPHMRPIILKLLQQETVTHNEWQDLFYSMYLVCLWDEKGVYKVREALKEDIMQIIKIAQQVCFAPFLNYLLDGTYSINHAGEIQYLEEGRRRFYKLHRAKPYSLHLAEETFSWS